MRGRVVGSTHCAHRHGRIRVRVKIPSGRRDYPPMGGLTLYPLMATIVAIWPN